MKGIIFNIQEFTVHDGPGGRVTVFMKGCPLRCAWCHNPEGLSPEVQLCVKHSLCEHCGLCIKPCSHAECAPLGRCIHACPKGLVSAVGKYYEAEELACVINGYRDILESLGGGVTFSGGEPLMQADFLLETIGKLKVHTAIETSGYAPENVFRAAVEALDFVIMDLKLADGALHKKYTGADNALILKNFKFLKRSGKEFLIRTPLIPGITDTDENISALSEIIGLAKWEKIPYNKSAFAKYPMFGMKPNPIMLGKEEEK